MRWDDLNMGDKSRMIKLAVDSGITDLRTIRDVYNSYAEGGHLFWPGGPINPKIIKTKLKNAALSLLPKNVSKGLASVASLTHGDILGAPIKDYYQYGVQEDWNPEEGFLMSPKNQQKYMEEIGYHKIDDGSYGMVNRAATRLKSLIGADIPIYQLGDDDISPDEVTLVSTKPEEVEPYFNRLVLSESNRLLRDPGSHPSALYQDKEGNYYLKSWDLNDYGQHGQSSEGTTYGGIRQALAEIYDFIGTPFVQRTGLIRVPTEKDMPTYDKSEQRAAEDWAKWYRERIANGEFSLGGKIHIKPENHDTLFAMGGKPKRRKTLIAELPEVTVTPQWLNYWEATPEQTRTLTNRNGKYNTTSMGDKGYTHFDTISARYKGLNAAMQRANFSDEEMSRLSPFLLTQLALEGGWVVDRPDNNFGGMMRGGKRIEFDTEDSFYDAYLKNLDARWGDEYLGKGKGWRNAKTINEYADIINREDLGLHTKEAFDEYNRKHRDHPAYIYTPLWENNNTGLMDKNKFGGIYDRALGNYELLMKRMGEWDKFARNNKIIAK